MEKLVYYSDSYKKEITTTITSIQGASEAHKKNIKNYKGDVVEVIFSDTIFYPEGGGQSGDRGVLVINNQEYKILDTQKLHNNVGHTDVDVSDTDYNLGIIPVHLVACKESDLEVGSTCTLKLDWTHRYHFMQSHTAQHLLSSLLYSKFNIPTVAVHLSDDIITIEVEKDVVTEQTIDELTSLANAAIIEGHEVTSKFYTHEEAQEFFMRRSIKVDTNVRIVTIKDLDDVACGGLHVSNTNECLWVTYQTQEKIRGHVRMTFKVATVAMNQIKEDRKIVANLCETLSAQSFELVELVKNLVNTSNELKYKYNLAQIELAKAMINREKVFLNITDSGLELKHFVQASSSFENLVAAFIKVSESRVEWLIIIKGNLTTLSFNDVKQNVLSSYNYRGGGKAPAFQGVITDCNKENAMKLLEDLKQFFA